MTDMIKFDYEQYGLDETKAADVKKDFDAVLKIAVELEDEFNQIVANEEITPELCKSAKELRLKYVKVRTGIAAVHKERKAFYLSGGRAVDGLKNAYTHAVTGNEERLKEIETHFERIEEEKRKAIHQERVEAIAKFEVEATGDLGGMDAEVWANYIAGVELNYKAKKEAEAKAEADRIAKEKAEAEERERIRLENEKLKAEREEMQKKAEAERIEREKAAKAERDRLAAIEAEREKERKAAEAKLKAEREAAAAKLKAEQEKLRKAEAEAQAKADAEAKEAAEQAKREANKAHRKRVNGKALEALMSQIDGITEEQAKAVIIQIGKGNIPHITINY